MSLKMYGVLQLVEEVLEYVSNLILLYVWTLFTYTFLLPDNRNSRGEDFIKKYMVVRK